MGQEDTDGLETFYKERTPLSDREAEVLVLMGTEIEQSETDKAARESVASKLDLSPNSVETYYRRALKKLKQYCETLERTETDLSAIADRIR